MQLRFITPMLVLALTSACGGRSSTTETSGTATSPETAGDAAVPAPESVTATAGAGAPSDDAVKAWVNESLQGLVNGSSSAPQAIALDFQSVEVGGAQTAGNDQVVAGVRNDTYYPVTVRYTENDTIGGEVQSKPIAYQYWFYVDQSGNWNAAKVGPV